MQRNVAHIRPKVVGPFSEPCSSRSFMHWVALWCSVYVHHCYVLVSFTFTTTACHFNSVVYYYKLVYLLLLMIFTEMVDHAC
jgi:hypothetical protein